MREQSDSPPVTFSHPNLAENGTSQGVVAPPRVSESGTMTGVITTPDVPTRELAAEDEQDVLVSEVSSGLPKTDFFQTDTSDVCDPFDSIGSEMLVNATTFSGQGSESGTNPEIISLPESGIKDVTSTNPRPCSSPKQLSASEL